MKPATDDFAFLDRAFEVDEVPAPTQLPLVTRPPDIPAGELYGFYYNMPFQQYAAVDALNGSKIVYMRRSAMAYRHLCDCPQVETDALRLGTLTHRAILEPELMGGLAIWGLEEWMKVRNGNRWLEWRDAQAGKTILTAKEFEAVTAMAGAVLAHEPIRRYAQAEGPTEVSLFWRHPLTGRRFKARLDKAIPALNTVFDLKTTRDSHSYRFGSQAYALGYHVKMGLYAQGYEILTGIRPELRLGAIESKAPHESTVYRVTPDVLAQGWDELDHLVGRITACEQKNCWPAEHEDETDLILPSWTQYQELDQYEDAA